MAQDGRVEEASRKRQPIRTAQPKTRLTAPGHFTPRRTRNNFIPPPLPLHLILIPFHPLRILVEHLWWRIQPRLIVLRYQGIRIEWA